MTRIFGTMIQNMYVLKNKGVVNTVSFAIIYSLNDWQTSFAQLSI